MNRATGSTTDGRPVLHSTSTPVAVASIGTRGRGIHSSATHAPTAQASAAHAAGPSTFARPQPSRASRSVVAAATGSSASASSTSAGEYHRLRRATGGPGCGDRAGRRVGRGATAGRGDRQPGHDDGRRLGVPGPATRPPRATRPARGWRTRPSRPPAGAGAPVRAPVPAKAPVHRHGNPHHRGDAPPGAGFPSSSQLLLRSGAAPGRERHEHGHAARYLDQRVGGRHGQQDGRPRSRTTYRTSPVAATAATARPTTSSVGTVV